jgi:hypothetical protein
MASVNDHYFFDKEERAASRRFAARGISIPEEDKLRPGETIYRIGHSDKSYEDGVAGAWWVRAETFEYLCSKSQTDDPDVRPDRAFRKLFRMKLAVAASFGRSDTIIQAQVLQSLRVWTGKGRLVRDTTSASTPISWIGGFEIAQLCIPGLMVEEPPSSKTFVKSPGYDSWLAPNAPIAAYSWFKR